MFQGHPNIFCTRLLPDGRVEIIHFDGSVKVMDAEAVEAQRAQRAERDRQMFEAASERMFAAIRDDHDDDSHSEPQIIHHDEPSAPEDHGLDSRQGASEQLAADYDLKRIARAFDVLLETGGGNSHLLQTNSPLADLANHYITLHGLGYPLFEIYSVDAQSARDTERDGQLFLGYRLSAAHALILPDQPHPSSDDEPVRWQDPAGMVELRRLIYILTDRDEVFDDWGIMSETSSWPQYACVSGGKIIRSGAQRENWQRAVDPAFAGSGHIVNPLPLATPLLVVTHYGKQKACTVAAWMQRSSKLDGALDTDLRWKTLCDLAQDSGYDWIEHSDPYGRIYANSDHVDTELVICTDGSMFDDQLVAYWLENRHLAIPQKRYRGSAASDWSNPHDQLQVWWRDPSSDLL